MLGIWDFLDEQYFCIGEGCLISTKKYCMSNVFVLEYGQFLEHSEYQIKTMP